MPNLKETLESISLLCWNTSTEDEVEEKVQEYLKHYPHLHNPACIDLLRETVRTWLRIRQLERQLEVETDPENARLIISRINAVQRIWLQMLGNLGITYTKQQYIKRKERVQPPLERLKMLKPRKREKK